MYTQIKRKVEPKLRFCEFKENWEERKLEQIAKIERGRFSPRPRNNPIYYGGEIPFVQTRDVVNSKGKIKNYSQTLNEKGLKVSKKFSKGTILITIAANIGFSGVLEIDMACPDSLIGLGCFKNINNYFLNYLLEIEQPKMDYLAVAAAQKNINIEFLKPYKFYFPSLPEQQKIASFLSVVETKIEQLTKKLTLLQTYKKGVAQKISNHEIRFKPEEGSDYPDWEEFLFNNIILRISTGLNPRKNFVIGKGNNFYVTIKNINHGKLDFSTCELIDDEAIKIIKKRSKLSKGDIIMSTIGNIGEAVLLKEDPKNWNINESVFMIRPNLKYVTSEYLYYIITSNSSKRYFEDYMTGSSFKSIKIGDLKMMPVKLPCINEQKKIASFLSYVDNKIELVNNQLDKNKAFKKGLLQQMFV